MFISFLAECCPLFPSLQSLRRCGMAEIIRRFNYFRHPHAHKLYVGSCTYLHIWWGQKKSTRGKRLCNGQMVYTPFCYICIHQSYVYKRFDKWTLSATPSTTSRLRVILKRFAILNLMVIAVKAAPVQFHGISVLKSWNMKRNAASWCHTLRHIIQNCSTIPCSPSTVSNVLVLLWWIVGRGLSRGMLETVGHHEGGGGDIRTETGCLQGNLTGWWEGGLLVIPRRCSKVATSPPLPRAFTTIPRIINQLVEGGERLRWIHIHPQL